MKKNTVKRKGNYKTDWAGAHPLPATAAPPLLQLQLRRKERQPGKAKTKTPNR
jgi:hypothetical protein